MIGIGRSIRKNSLAATFPGGDRIFHRIFTRLGCQGRPPNFVVELYPYANLAHTMRLRQETAHVRLSDILRDAPVPVIEAAAAILLAQMIVHNPRGVAHDLEPMFAVINLEYFDGNLHRPRLGWSTRPWRSQFGCFDPSLDQIVMNNRLDRAEVPSYAVELILYHEMLHVKHPLRAAACGLQAHSAEFRAEEKRFKHYERARKFLDHVR